MELILPRSAEYQLLPLNCVLMQVLYEFIFSTGSAGDTFTISKAMPREPILLSNSITIDNCDIRSGDLLMIEAAYDDDSDLFNFLNEDLLQVSRTIDSIMKLCEYHLLASR